MAHWRPRFLKRFKKEQQRPKAPAPYSRGSESRQSEPGPLVSYDFGPYAGPSHETGVETDFGYESYPSDGYSPSDSFSGSGGDAGGAGSSGDF